VGTKFMKNLNKHIKSDIQRIMRQQVICNIEKTNYHFLLNNRDGYDKNQHQSGLINMIVDQNLDMIYAQLLNSNK